MNRPLPVTLVGGFFGAGKTSLLHHFISEHATGPIAVLVESAAGSHLDASALRGLTGAMRRPGDLVREIPSLEESAQIDWLAHQFAELSQIAGLDRVLVEVGAASNAARLGRHFSLLPGHSDRLASQARLDRMVCVIDALDFFYGVALPAQRGTTAAFLDFQSAQIQGATLLVLNKSDLVSEAERAACCATLRKINSAAALVETTYGELSSKIWLRPDNSQTLGLAVEERSPSKTSQLSAPVPPQDFELGAMTYRIHRPFHPGRFWDWFEADHPGLLRVKGLVWLATRNLLVGGISRTRGQSSCGGAGIWWAALPREEWPSDPASLKRMQENWREPWGDRRQELVLAGKAATLPAITRQLAGCLLTDDEYARPTGEWTSWPDPFPLWDVGAEA